MLTGMHPTRFRDRHRRDRQDGYILLGLLLAVTLLSLALTMELPNIGVEIRRQREDEMIHRGVQYARAVKRFYRKFGRYPLSVEQLENTNGFRFLRRRYKDPITGKDFRILRLNEVQFGETPLTAAPRFDVNSHGENAPDSTVCPSPAIASPLSSGAFTAVLPAGGTSGAHRSQSGPVAPGYASDSVVGVASTSTKTGFHTFNEKDSYKDWMFIYDSTWDIGNLITSPYSTHSRASTKPLIPCQVIRSSAGNNNNSQ